jgi:dolichol-phosphate mannosyltransferase
LQSDLAGELVSDRKNVDLSIIIPTYNESENILYLLKSVIKNIPSSLVSEIIVVDDNSPDRTGEIAEKYSSEIQASHVRMMEASQRRLTVDSSCEEDKNSALKSQSFIKVIHRAEKKGLIPAILEGVYNSKGRYILVMDADFSHSPERIPVMISELEDQGVDIVVASRYVKGGSIIGWPLKRRLISKGAVKIAKYG